MKRIITIIIAALALVFLTTSCNKDKYGTYEFFTNIYLNVTDSGRAGDILESIAKDNYFFTKQSYTETYNNAATLAANDFLKHIDGLDTDYIKSQLKYGEYVKISLWSMDPGNCLLTCIITSDSNTVEDYR